MKPIFDKTFNLKVLTSEFWLSTANRQFIYEWRKRSETKKKFNSRWLTPKTSMASLFQGSLVRILRLRPHIFNYYLRQTDEKTSRIVNGAGECGISKTNTPNSWKLVSVSLSLHTLTSIPVSIGCWRWNRRVSCWSQSDDQNAAPINIILSTVAFTWTDQCTVGTRLFTVGITATSSSLAVEVCQEQASWLVSHVSQLVSCFSAAVCWKCSNWYTTLHEPFLRKGYSRKTAQSSSFGKCIALRVIRQFRSWLFRELMEIRSTE